MPTASELRAVSSALTQRAAWLATALDPVARLSSSGIWRGPVADRFDGDLDDQRRRLRALADEITLAGRLLLTDADAIDLDPAAAPARTLMGRPS